MYILQRVLWHCLIESTVTISKYKVYIAEENEEMRSCVVRNRFSSLFAKGCLHTDGDAKLAESIFQTCFGTMQFNNMLHSVS